MESVYNNGVPNGIQRKNIAGCLDFVIGFSGKVAA